MSTRRGLHILILLYLSDMIHQHDSATMIHCQDLLDSTLIVCSLCGIASYLSSFLTVIQHLENV